MVVEMAVRSGTFQHFGAVEGMLWAMILLTLPSTCITTRRVTHPSRKEQAAYSRGGNSIISTHAGGDAGPDLGFVGDDFLLVWCESCNLV
jgi:hypothetical protein